MRKISSKMAKQVQQTVGYRFTDRGLLNAAFQAAHKSRDGEVLDDGNRGLAKIGTCAIDMVEACNIIVAESKSKSKSQPSLHLGSC
jgi:hypothetical protein